MVDIRVLVFKENSSFVAVGLEPWLASQGKTADDAYKHFENMLLGSVALLEQYPNHISPFHPESTCKVAPQHLLNMWPKDGNSKKSQISMEAGNFKFNIIRIDV